MKELNCINCGAAVSFQKGAKCEYCDTPVVLTPEARKQFEQEKRDFERTEKKKIDAHVRSTLKFIPENQQVGALNISPKVIVGMPAGLLFIILFRLPAVNITDDILLHFIAAFFVLCPILTIVLTDLRLKSLGISNFGTFWKYPKLNPRFGYEVINHARTGTVSYETALRALLAANIPLPIAINSLLLEGLEVRVETVRHKLGRPF